MLTAAQRATLKAFVQSVPALNALAVAGNDIGLATALNAPHATATTYMPISGAQMLAATSKTERDALTAANKTEYAMLAAAPVLDGNSAEVRKAFTDLFGPATATRAAVLALITRKRTVAEEALNLNGVWITTDMVARAMRIAKLREEVRDAQTGVITVVEHDEPEPGDD